MEVEIITKFEDFLSLENIWNNVLEKSQSDYVCLTFEWFKSWWLSFGKNKELRILLLKDKNSILGIVPLMISRSHFRGLPVREIGFIQNENTPRNDLILNGERKDAIDAIVKYFKNNLGRWDVICLVNIPQESPNYEILQDTLKRNNKLFGIKKGLYSPFIRIQSDWKTYFSSRTKKFRKAVRNNINRIERIGPYHIKKIENINQDGTVLANIFEISKNSWKAKYQKQITRSDENKRFFEELSQVSSERGWLNIWLLNINDRTVAYEYHLRYKNRIYALRADFDEAYKDSSPGSVLDMHIVKYAFENKLKEYDMCGSDDFYKKNWTFKVREHVRFIIFKDSFYGKLLYILEFKVIYFLKEFKLIKKLKEVFIGKRGRR